MRRDIRFLVLAGAGVLALGLCTWPSLRAAGQGPGVSPSSAVRAGSAVTLPKQAGPWLRPDAPRRITDETIFDYMDGAGELYLAYRFDHLDVYEYSAADSSLGTIIVELYWMKGSDDAFGLLSTDWGGEAIGLGGKAAIQSGLYGGGLLRFWNGDLYGRVMASRESPQSRAQVLAIARSIVGGRPGSERPPEILSKVPPRLDERLTLRPERTCFFRSHLVLNSIYYLAPEDVLGLGLAVDASASEYRAALPGARPVHLVQIRYPSADAAAATLRRFVESYLPAPDRPAAGTSGSGTANVEGHWVGWSSRDRWLALVLDAPDAGVANDLATAGLMALIKE